MKVPSYFKRTKCAICEKLCVPMTHGDRFFNVALGKYQNVVVCSDCDKLYGDDAYDIAGFREEQKLWNS